MRIQPNREAVQKSRAWKFALVLLTGIFAISLVRTTQGAKHSVATAQDTVPRAVVSRVSSTELKSTSNAQPIFTNYCSQCHSGTAAKAGVNLEKLLTEPSVGESFKQWEKVVTALEQKTMPPKSMPQPSDAERTQAIAWIRGELNAYAEKHDGDPGRVTVRKLTSGEYAYTIKDLTGVDLEVGIDSSSDAVGG